MTIRSLLFFSHRTRSSFYFFSLRILLFLSSPPPSRPSPSVLFLVFPRFFFILEERPQPPGTQVYPFVSILAFPSPSPFPFLTSFVRSFVRSPSVLFSSKTIKSIPTSPQNPRRVQPIPLANHHPPPPTTTLSPRTHARTQHNNLSCLLV